MQAEPSNRSLMKGTLNFGLVTIPITVYTGAVSDYGNGITRNEFVEKTGNRARQLKIDEVTKKPVTKNDIVKMVATENGPVYVEDHEIETLFALQPNDLTIKSFQPEALWHGGHYVPKSIMHIIPTKVKVGSRMQDKPATVQALSMVLGAMRTEGAIAVAEYTSRGIPQPAVLLSDGTLWTVRFEEEVRKRHPLPQVEVPEPLLDQARMLIRAQWSDGPTPFVNERAALIQAFADEKALADDRAKPVEVAVVEPVDTTVDLMAMLHASISASSPAQEKQPQVA